jgi:uncharacterized RDD family membrane protein YckC
MVYDLILLIAVLLLATAPLLLLTGGRAIAHGNLLYDGWLLLVCWGYFCWQWVHGGQTLGMKAWRVRVVRRNHETLRWSHASLRFLHALFLLLPLGAGLWWMIVDRDRLALYDRTSGTALFHYRS